MPLFADLGQGGPLGAIGNNRPARWKVMRGADPLGAWLLGTTYADYDARKLDRMFQESTGQTPVAASADKVGLWLDGSQFGTKTLAQVIAGQAEQVTNGGFDTDTGWSKATGVTIAGGVADFSAVSSGGLGQTLSGVVLGSFYRVSLTISNRSIGGVSLRIGTGTFTAITQANGTYSVIVQASGSNALTIAASTANTTLQLDNVSIKAVPGYHSLNGTSTQRLNLLISGSRYSLTADGTDDNLLSTYLAGAGANSILIDTDVPASLAATQVIAGMSGSATARLSIGINTSGQLCAGVGSDANTTIVGSTDWRGTRLIAALSADGSTVKLLSATGEEYSAAQNGSPTTTIPARLAANNNNGTASTFYGGGIARVILAQKALDLTTFNAIRTQLLAA